MKQPNVERRSPRREFLGQLGAAALAAGTIGTVGIGPLAAQAPASRSGLDAAAHQSAWDMGWLDLLANAKYRAAFDSTSIADGAALDLAADFIQQFRLVHDTRVEDTRAVIIMRQLSAQLGFGDALWNDYRIGEDTKINDPATGKPALRNPYLKASPDQKPDYIDAKLETLRANGAIFLVCNRAAMNASARLATKMNRDVEAVRAEVRAGLVPGAVLMPSGIFALIRAQNAGCAYMRGS